MNLKFLILVYKKYYLSTFIYIKCLNINNFFSKYLNIYNNSNRMGKTFEEIGNIMPPNILVYQNSTN